MKTAHPILHILLTLAACNSGGVATETSSAATTSATSTSGASATDEPTAGPGSGGVSPTTSTTVASTGTDSGSSDANLPDLPGSTDTTTGDPFTCERPGGCDRLDIVLVIDNSRGMAENQQAFAAIIPHLVSRLRTVVGRDGAPVDPDVNIMVTTTDVGHPICEIFQLPEYTPQQGAPVQLACTDRLNLFAGIGDDPDVPELCTDVCKPEAAAAPKGSFIHFDSLGDNIADPDGLGDPVADALACLVPQGASGCGFEAQLEAMFLALAPAAEWNLGRAPFLREGAALAIVLLTDESDCSTQDFKYFDPDFKDHPEFGQYWAINPNTMEKQGGPSSAICWNAGMACDDPEMDGVYATCVPQASGALFPINRYVNRLANLARASGKPVFMLALSGVPPVTAHSPDAPHVPTAGGAADLVYRDWVDADVLPGDLEETWQKQMNYGIGPGCVSPTRGYATPPGRILEVCRSLDRQDDPQTPANEAEIRCCVESTCDDDVTPAVDCLIDVVAQQLQSK